MFADRLNTVLHIICASGSDIARFMDCDRSNVSRFLKGQRVPKRGGGAAQRLAGALYAAAESTGRTEELCGLASCGYDSAEDARAALIEWLFQDEQEPEEKSRPASEQTPNRTFGMRLSAVMQLAEISNTHLGRLLSLDPSYISRFRSGMRSPKSNQHIMNGMAATLLARVNERGRLKELRELMKYPGKLPEESDKLYDLFYTWLYGDDKDDGPAIEVLMEQISALPITLKAPKPLQIPWTDIYDRNIYFGNEGLRMAVIRFLSEVYEKGQKELYLYSDQSMDWMTEIAPFRAEWAALMAQCIQNGTRISIIHNVERGFEEMTKAINSWLPLYPSGMIRSYYCRRKTDSRFSTTMFLCPGCACVSGHNVKDKEGKLGMYRYDLEPDILNAHLSSFKGLLEESGELIKTFDTLQIERITHNAVSGLTVLTSRLSLATMPDDVLMSLLRRADATSGQKQRVIEMWKRQRAYYMQCLDRFYIHECIPITDDLSPPADLPGINIRYTGAEYIEHLSELYRMLREYPSYLLYPMAEPAFDNVRIRMVRDEIIVSRLSSPNITFDFEHPYMCGSFIAYGKKIKEAHSREMANADNLLRDIINS